MRSANPSYPTTGGIQRLQRLQQSDWTAMEWDRELMTEGDLFASILCVTSSIPCGNRWNHYPLTPVFFFFVGFSSLSSFLFFSLCWDERWPARVRARNHKKRHSIEMRCTIYRAGPGKWNSFLRDGRLLHLPTLAISAHRPFSVAMPSPNLCGPFTIKWVALAMLSRQCLNK